VKEEKEVYLSEVDGLGLPAVMQGVDLDQTRRFAAEFRAARLQLGLTQTQVGQALTGAGEDAAVSQSTICRFEKLEVTAVQVRRLVPVLRAWLAGARRRAALGLPALPAAAETVEQGKKRKKRTVFSPDTVAELAVEFGREQSPSAARLAGIADRLGLDKETVRVWFCNKRQQSRRSCSD